MIDVAEIRRAAISLAVIASFLAVVTSADAATLTQTPPAQVTDGAGPFTWSFVSDGTHAYSWVAYRLSTETGWHRCVANGMVTIENLPVGTYSIEITNDVDLEDWAARGLGNSFDAQACHMSPPPDSPYARRISNFSVITPAVVATPTTPGTSPTLPVTPPTVPVTSPAGAGPGSSSNGGPSAACRTAKQTAHNIRAGFLQALRRAASEAPSSKRRFWRGVAEHRRESLDRQLRTAKRQCAK
jgi:hypothetical protein